MLTILLSISTFAVALLLTSSDSKVYAVTVNKPLFSVKLLDNWAYANAKLQNGEGSGIIVIPTEFSDFLANSNGDYQKLLENLSVYSLLIADTSYPFENVPLDIYVQYRVNASYDAFMLWPKKNTAIDGKKALKIYGNVGDNSTNADQMVGYYVFYEGNPYRLEFYATENYYQKYLPQFEKMVKTFKFVK